MVKMSGSHISSEPIINPAPAQVFISDSAIQADQRRSQQVVHTRTGNGVETITDMEKSRENKIKDLKQQLRVIKNIAQPLNQYMQFQQIMDPKLRVIIEVNQWIMLLLAGKSALTSAIGDTYADISEPPGDLMIAMEEGYNNIDSTVNNFTASMSQIVTLMQSQLTSDPLR